MAHPAPHRSPHSPAQRRAAPHVHRRRDQRVQACHDGEQVSGLVPKPQAVPRQLPDDYINEGRTPECQENDHHEHDDAQRLLLVVSVGTRRLSDQLVPGYDV